MNDNIIVMPETPEKIVPKWHHPLEVMKLHKLKQKKKALQARINGSILNNKTDSSATKTSFDEVFSSKKRKNPFLKDTTDCKKSKTEPCVLDESTDQTLFKLLHQNVPGPSTNVTFTSFNNILSKIETEGNGEIVEVVKATGEKWLPIDWTLKYKVRLLSTKPFPWNQKLKISEEASGITAFTRCLSSNTDTTLDTSPNAKFHQCCLYWQQPCLPWINLFPRSNAKAQSTGNNFILNNSVRESLQSAWSDSLRSLYQLIRTRQCPYFYACTNNFTVLFRAAGICGFSDVHVLITPTTRGFRQMLRQEDIDFVMPLQKKRVSDLGYETDSTVSEKALDEEAPDEHWLKSMGINAEDIKQINYTQVSVIYFLIN